MAERLRTSASEFKQRVGKYLDAARTGPVVIERQGRATAVLISIEEYEKLEPTASRSLDLLESEYDQLVGRMQTAQFHDAMESAFETPVEEIGRAYRPAKAGLAPTAKPRRRRAG
ncbi:MAG TPA: type II toxin-antitoxin system Phd/YefM family antitoxin [Candidatus Binatia bacterium]|nr:type II toxin-antitoxin system Phd/YefM family antitoxin [Candidatus Binatia bacterium]